ncbi:MULTISPECIES: lipopolysaccharide biosynthesis protein [unclassified Frankia]|uniref:lipopolysaccharide biosynthesis protein n=1 Tax=unclassified Frankia TaxID=2632575 RepID=UPI001931A0D3|nr:MULTISPECIES: hypothetical protein [unclassified Frankia]MBL7492341.1 hypothetical protein [Frankia sp. AgW1.1]MBL7622293.1 hypothetical protein [Frankia sp. AgB1.8]
MTSVTDEAAAVAGAEQPRRKMSMLYRNGLAGVANSVLSALLGAGFWVIAARESSTTAVAVGTALVSALMALATLSQMSLGGALSAYLPGAGEHQRALVLRSYGMAVLISVVLGGAFAAAAPRLDHSFHILAPVGAAIGFTLSVTVWAIFSLQDLVVTSLRKAIWLPLENTTYSLTKFVVLVAMGSGTTALMLLTAWVVPAAIATVVVSSIVFGKLLNKRESGAEPAVLTQAPQLEGYRRFLAGTTLALIFEQLAVTLLPVFIVAGLGTEKGAEFGIAWMLIQALDQFPMILGFSMTVEGAQPGADVRPIHRTLRKRTVVGMGGLVVVGILAAPIITTIFGGAYRHGSTTILQLLLIGSVGRAVNSLALCAALARRRLAPLIGIHGAIAVMVPIGALVLGRWWGLVGVGIAWSVAQSVVALGVLVAERREEQSERVDTPPGLRRPAAIEANVETTLRLTPIQRRPR